MAEAPGRGTSGGHGLGHCRRIKEEGKVDVKQRRNTLVLKELLREETGRTEVGKP